MNKNLPHHEIVGEIDIPFFGKIDIGDPRYGDEVKDGVYRGMALVPGPYLCEVNRRKDGHVSSMVFRHKELADDLNLSVLKGQVVGVVAVDSGLMSIAASPRPAYTYGKEWLDFCRLVGKREEGETGTNGCLIGPQFVCTSGYGDGVYPVSVHKNETTGRNDMVMVRF